MTKRILLISGSTRDASSNTAALRTLVELAPAGVAARMYGGLRELPAFVPEGAEPAAVAALRAELAAADAVVFCTPEYAGTLPGSLKNLLDWTVGNGDLHGKPAAWINVAADPRRGGGATETLALVLGYVDAVVIEAACLRIPVSQDIIGPDGVVADAAARDRLAAVLRTVAAYPV